MQNDNMGPSLPETSAGVGVGGVEPSSVSCASEPHTVYNSLSPKMSSVRVAEWR